MERPGFLQGDLTSACEWEWVRHLGQACTMDRVSVPSSAVCHIPKPQLSRALFVCLNHRLDWSSVFDTFSHWYSSMKTPLSLLNMMVGALFSSKEVVGPMLRPADTLSGWTQHVLPMSLLCLLVTPNCPSEWKLKVVMYVSLCLSCN